MALVSWRTVSSADSAVRTIVDVFLDPVDVALHANIDTRPVGKTTHFRSPAHDPGQLPSTVGGMTRQRAAGITRARILAALAVPGADHSCRVVAVPAAVPVPLSASLTRDRSYDHLLQLIHRSVVCSMYTR